jgi:hypothetical protein
VIGLPYEMAVSDLIKSDRLFGQYGKIVKIIINQSPKF